MTKVKTPKIRSKINSSPAFEAIMEKYKLFGTSIPMVAFYREYVKTMDPDITYRMWEHYVKRLKLQITIKTEEITNRVTDTLATESSMENNSMRKILAIGDLTLDKFIEKPELLEEIPIEQRVDWIFSVMKARDSRMVAAAKLQGEKRKTSMYEDIIQGAQYGAIEAEDISDRPAPAKPVPIIAAPLRAAAREEVEFSPAEFEEKQYGD